MKQLFRSVHECTIENGWEFFLFRLCVVRLYAGNVCVCVRLCVHVEWEGRYYL